MAFADIIRSITPSFGDTADLLEDLLVVPGIASSGLINTSSTSFTDFGSISITENVATDQIAEIRWMVNVAHGTLGEEVRLRLLANGVDVSGQYIEVPSVASTFGDVSIVSMGLSLTNLSGSVTFKPQWRVTAGTAYSARSSFQVFLHRQG